VRVIGLTAGSNGMQAAAHAFPLLIKQLHYLVNNHYFDWHLVMPEA